MICVTVDVRDDEGRSPLDILLEGIDDLDWFKQYYGFPIAHYLLSCGYGDKEDRVKWLYKACRWGQLEVVKELVERHNVDPNGEHTHTACMECVSGVHVHISKRVDIHVALLFTLTQW